MGQAGDVGELAENIEWMMNHPEEAESSAALGRDIVLKSHTWAAHASHLASLFEEMMAEANDTIADILDSEHHLDELD